MAKSINPFRYFDSSPEVIRLVVMMYVRYPLSLRNVEDLLFERGIDICHETVRLWWNRFGPIFAGEIRRKRVMAFGEGALGASVVKGLAGEEAGGPVFVALQAVGALSTAAMGGLSGAN